ncbi:hypothetical protein T03_7967 [Trichinella britovi]|uniref:Uncharacterized protein n=1 Tax=Trichinella britovi TaxID=45882 RepID=A0A0V0YYQ9_TRIBR|nr:hypothetical protein T03_7967 [Trichinella britovi]
MNELKGSVIDLPNPWSGHGSSIMVCVHSVTLTVPMQAEYFEQWTLLD